MVYKHSDKMGKDLESELIEPDSYQNRRYTMFSKTKLKIHKAEKVGFILYHNIHINQFL